MHVPPHDVALVGYAHIAPLPLHCPPHVVPAPAHGTRVLPCGAPLGTGVHAPRLPATSHASH
jgi:hypothetical protein